MRVSPLPDSPLCTDHDGGIRPLGRGLLRTSDGAVGLGPGAAIIEMHPARVHLHVRRTIARRSSGLSIET